jgi:hypothetical protein
MRARNTLIMAVLVVVLGALVYVLEFRGSDEREAAEAIADRLLDFAPEEVTAMTIESAEGRISLARANDAWRVTAPYDLAADDTAVSSIVNRLQTADRDRVIDEAPEDLARFGLDEPQVSVTLQLADGDSRSLALGNGTPVGFNVFVQSGDGDTVYTTPASLKDTVNKTLYDLRDRSILSFVNTDVARVEIDGPEVDATVERQPDLGDGITRWALSEPLEASADTDTVSALVSRFRTGTALAFPTDDPSDEQLDEFGLDAPEITLRLWTGDSAAHTLQIGGSAEEPSGRYARRLGSDAVMIIPDDLVNELPGSADALRNRTVVEFARDRVNAIDIDTDAEDKRLEKDGIDWRIRRPRALDGDAAAVSSLLTAALGLRALEFAAGDADSSRFGFAAPRARVSFELEALPGLDAGTELPAETVTLLLGATTEVAGDETVDTAEGDDEPEPIAARYVRVGGQPTVFVVAEEDLSDIDVDLFTLRSKTLVSFGQSQLTRLEVTDANGATRELVKNEDGDWTHDGEAVSPDLSANVDDMLWRLNYLNMLGVVVEPDGSAALDLAPFGLDTPVARVRAFIDDEGVADVSIGGDVPEEQLQDEPAFAARTQTYGVVEGAPGVFRIDAALRDAVRTLLEALS